jgi:predicted dehydrogenase
MADGILIILCKKHTHKTKSDGKGYKMSKEKIRCGIIGLGLVYRFGHAQAYRKLAKKAQVIAVCDADGLLAEEEANKYHAKPYTDYRDLLDNPEIDAVDIILPHHLHYQVAKLAIEKGKHVITEKPMTVHAEEALELIELANKNKRIFALDENTRFVKAYIEVKKLLDKNMIGEPRLIRTLISGSEVHRLRNTFLWKGKKEGSGGGTIIDAGAHSFFLLKWLFGEIECLQAGQAKLIDESEVEDWAVITGKLKNKALFSLEFTFTSEGPWNERLEIHGSKGLIIVDQLINPPARRYKCGFDYTGIPISNIPYEPYRWKYYSIADGIIDFIDSILENRRPAIDPMDGYYTMKAIDYAYKSIHDGKAVYL